MRARPSPSLLQVDVEGSILILALRRLDEDAEVSTPLGPFPDSVLRKCDVKQLDVLAHEALCDVCRLMMRNPHRGIRQRSKA